MSLRRLILRMLGCTCMQCACGARAQTVFSMCFDCYERWWDMVFSLPQQRWVEEDITLGENQ